MRNELVKGNTKLLAKLSKRSERNKKEIRQRKPYRIHKCND